jgi:hypothetical protein
MRPDLLLAHTRLSRRAVFGLAGKTAATAALAGGLLGVAACTDQNEQSAAPRSPEPQGAGGTSPSGTGGPGNDDYDDEMFDVAAAEGGAWAPSRYGAQDQRGTFNEVTPEKTAAALGLLAAGQPTKTYNLGELMTNGFPAFKTTPPRVYEQRLTVFGYEPPPGFAERGGILQSVEPLGENKVSIHEERFPQGYTYQIITQLDNLNHIGVGPTFYNGFKGPEIADAAGTTKLGNEHMGPIVTRGVLLDILGLKVDGADRGALAASATGDEVLRDNYRISLEDIRAAMERGGIDSIEPGDVVLFRTGWNKIARSEPERYLAQEPGIYLRESRWLAARRPAIVGSDTWGLEVLGNEAVKAAFPVHQELLVKEGIRIGEGMISDALADDKVYEFVYIITPQYAKGATAGNTPPAALAQPKR